MKMYSDVFNSLKTLLARNFADIAIEALVVNTEPTRPYFQMAVKGSKASNSINSYKLTSLNLILTYKAASIENDKKELLDMMSSLENILLRDDLHLGDSFFASIYRVECVLKEDTLTFNFTLNYREEFEEIVEESEFIDNIIINI